MTVTRNTGSDLLPLGRPLPPGEATRTQVRGRIERAERRVQAIKAAEVRAVREDPELRPPYDGHRLLDDLRSVREASRDPFVMASRLQDGADDLEELKQRGWTNESIRAAAVAVAERARVAPSPPGRAAASTVAAGVGRPFSGTPAPAVALNPRDRAAVARNIATARAMGYDPVALWPSLRGLVASGAPDGTPDRRAGGGPGTLSSSPGRSTANSPSGAPRSSRSQFGATRRRP